jgi:shikimate kinase
MTGPIVLIGPYLCGRSTIRRLLADALRLKQCSLSLNENENFCSQYYKQNGFDNTFALHILNEKGHDGLYEYLKPFEAYAVARCLSDHPDHIIELGATQSVYEDAQLFQSVQQALVPYPDVVLLLPSPDRAKSYEVLRRRYWSLNDLDLNDYFIKHHSNPDLAKFSVYTKGKTPADTCEEILQLVRARESGDSNIILIGPRCVGKSTIARLLSARLGIEQVSLDEVGHNYYQGTGFDEELANQIRTEMGFRGFYCYMQPFLAIAVERVLSKYKRCVIDFGAGHSVYMDDDLFARVHSILAPFENVFLLLPSPDLNESVQILRDRPKLTINGMDANKYLINHPSNYALAKHVVYTDKKTPEQTRDEILRFIKR